MKRFGIFLGLCGITLLLVKIMEYVFEYYETHWSRVEIGK